MVNKSVAVLLLIMSLASWMAIIIKTLDLVKYKGKVVLQKLSRFAHDLQAYFVTVARVTSGGTAIVVPMRKA